jgi:hypothetical protein
MDPAEHERVRLRLDSGFNDDAVKFQVEVAESGRVRFAKRLPGLDGAGLFDIFGSDHAHKIAAMRLTSKSPYSIEWPCVPNNHKPGFRR